MILEDLIKDKKAVVFGLDDILYPEKDYLLQVYYLFAEFLAYIGQFDSAKIISFMQNEFMQNGSEMIFEKTAKAFDIPDQYKENFLLLHKTARLPLKLLLYQQILSLLQELVVERKEIFLLVDGNPEQQINKIKQFEWHGLEQYLKLYFADEFSAKPSSESLSYIMDQHHLSKADILLVGKGLDEQFAAQSGVAYFNVTKLL